MRLSDEDITRIWLNNGGDLSANRFHDFARAIEAEVAERICVAVLDSCAQAAADNNDLRVYELMRGQAEAVRAAYKEPTNG